MPMFESKVTTPSKRICLNGDWQFRQCGKGEWLPAKVPGCNFTDLLENGVIDDPFYRDEELNLQWIEKRDWEYQREFDVSQQSYEFSKLELVTEGLDTYCSVYLNGELVLENNNMFVGHRVDCKPYLSVGKNQIKVVFRSPVNEVMPTFLENGFTYPAENDKSEERLSVFTRKAPYHYGWDWGPRFVTSGIWRDIYLEATDKARITQLDVEQLSLDDELAQVKFKLQLTTTEAFEGVLRLNCHNVDLDYEVSIDQSDVGSSEHEVVLDIAEPKRWWPNGLGEAFLYQFEASLEKEAKVYHHTSINLGLRTIEVVNEPDPEGECFYIKVNGHPVFMKGANYIPSDSFLNRVSDDKYQQIFADAVSANMNMLRVWGGGIYEDDRFYDLADQHGILIWQDFMFACTLYPADEAFVENVQAEVKYNIERLRNHPCIALWCGNNETEMGIEFWNWPTTFSYSDKLYDRLKSEYDLVFKQVLPDLVKAFDPSRFYFSSSPIGFWENKQDDFKGDNHYWGVWHGEEPFSEFKNRVPRFMSEYGFQSFPLMESVEKYSKTEDWHLTSGVMKVHQKHPRGNSLIKQYMQGEFHEPESFEHFLYVSQVQQALGMKVGFEAHRRAMPFCMGSLYWQFNDCWPVASWSSIDYYGKWKALHYQAKRSFEPVAVLLDETDNVLSTTLVSDRLTSYSLILRERLVAFDGSMLWSQSGTVDIGPSSSEVVATREVQEMLTEGDLADAVYIAELVENDRVISQALHYFKPTKELSLQKVDYQVTSYIEQGNLVFDVQAQQLARQVYLNLPNTSGNFSDNFFDLIPGQVKRVFFPIGELTDKETSQLADTLTILSIADTYN